LSIHIALREDPKAVHYGTGKWQDHRAGSGFLSEMREFISESSMDTVLKKLTKRQIGQETPGGSATGVF
jgi:hypothetical protein